MKSPTEFSRLSENAIKLAISAGLLILLAIFLVPALAGISLVLERAYNEGFNLYHALRLHGGGDLYLNPWLANNYPFLSFFFTSKLAPLFGGDLLLTGRWLSVAGLALAALSLFWTCRSLGAGIWEAWIGTGVGVGVAFGMASGWVGSDDPHFLGQGLSMLALAVYASRPDDARRIVLAAVIFTAAGFVKHNLIAVPIAIGLDLLFRSWRNLLVLVATTAVTAGALLVAQYWVAGPGFFAAVLGHPRAFDIRMFARIARKPFDEVAIPLAAAMLTVLLPGAHLRLFRLFLAAGALEILFAVGEGVYFNILLELIFAIGVGCALLLTAMRKAGFPARLTLAAAILMCMPVALQAVNPLRAIPGLTDRLRAAAAAFKADTEWLSQRQGAVICESMLLCLAAGHDLVLDPFNSRQMILAGRVSQAELLEKIVRREFAAIQLRSPIFADPDERVLHPTLLEFERFTGDFIREVARHYRLERSATGRAMYVPKGTVPG